MWKFHQYLWNKQNMAACETNFIFSCFAHSSEILTAPELIKFVFQSGHVISSICVLEVWLTILPLATESDPRRWATPASFIALLLCPTWKNWLAFFFSFFFFIIFHLDSFGHRAEASKVWKNRKNNDNLKIERYLFFWNDPLLFYILGPFATTLGNAWHARSK